MIFYFNEQYRDHNERFEAQARAEHMARLLTVLQDKSEHNDFTKEFYKEIQEQYNIVITRTQDGTLIKSIEMPEEIYTMLLLLCPEKQ